MSSLFSLILEGHPLDCLGHLGKASYLTQIWLKYEGDLGKASLWLKFNSRFDANIEGEEMKEMIFSSGLTRNIEGFLWGEDFFRFLPKFWIFFGGGGDENEGK